jgi:hypothetical protein
MKARAQEPWGEQVSAGQGPEHGSLEAGRDACGEQGGAAGELAGEARFDHLVEDASGKAASRQALVHIREAEG